MQISRPKKRPRLKRRLPLVNRRNEQEGGARRTPERTCIAGGGALAPALLIRFARAPDGSLTPDLGEKLPGRGAWVTPTREALARAVAKGLFARAFKAETTAPDDLVERIEAGLEKRLADALGLARREGAAVAGFDQVKAALEKGEAGVLIAASDAADDGRGKLSRRAGAAAVFSGLSSAALSAALGKDGVRHAAIKKGGAASRFLKEARRLSGLRPGTLTGDELDTADKSAPSARE